MRLVRVSLSGFRGWTDPASIDLDADTVVLAGANGSGKTSLLDAILWAITGRIERLGRESSVVSLFSATGFAEVEVLLRLGTSSDVVTIRRTTDGSESQVSVTAHDRELAGSEASVEISRLLWPEGLAANKPDEALYSAITRSVYLQQDVIRGFIEADNDQSRFDAVSEIVGGGRIVELQVQLDRQKTAWVRSLNERDSALADDRRRLARLRDEYQRLPSEGPEPRRAAAVAAQWLGRAASIDDSIASPAEAPPDLPMTSQSVDSALRTLASLRSITERQRANAAALAEQIAHPVVPSVSNNDLVELDLARKAAVAQIQRLETDLAARRKAAGAAMARLRSQRQEAEEVASLAALALRHLGDRCPVCTQDYERDVAIEHLTRLMNTRPTTVPTDTFEDLEKALLSERQRHDDLEARVARTRQQIASAKVADEQVKRRLQELELPAGAGVPQLENLVTQLDRRLDNLLELIREGEQTALELARSMVAPRRQRISNEIATLERKVQQVEAEIGQARHTADAADAIQQALRRAITAFVRERISDLSPLLQRLYSGIDPHPALRNVSFEAGYEQRRGRLATVLTDALSSANTRTPVSHLSSSQLNALAVSVFLALNLGQSRPPLNAIVLDDPLQSLDEIHVLGLCDLLRRVQPFRQVIVSTHDRRIASLLLRKFRPVQAERRAVVVRLGPWSRKGPEVEAEEIRSDESPFRLVA